MWFGNEAGRYAKGDGGQKMKDENLGNPTSTKSWTAKSVCGKVHSQRIAEVQTRLSGGEEKLLAHYGAARTEYLIHFHQTKWLNAKDWLLNGMQ